MTTVVLPDIILYHIIRYLNSDIDRIVLLLVCKRWYDKRDTLILNNTFGTGSDRREAYSRSHKYYSQRLTQSSKDRNRLMAIKEIKEYKDRIIGLRSFHKCFDNLLDRFHFIEDINDLIYLSKKREIQLRHQQEQLDGGGDNNQQQQIFKDTVFISNKFNRKIPPNLLPSTVESLFIEEDYHYALEKDVLPMGLKRLILTREYTDKIEPGVLPESLEDLRLSDQYNHPLGGGVLPRSLKSLILGIDYSEPLAVGDLPPTLEYIDMGYDYNTLLEPGLLPESIRSLELPYAYTNQLITNSIPLKNLESLVLPAISGTPTSVDRGGIPTNYPGSETSTASYIDNYDGCLENLPPTIRSLSVKTTPSSLDIRLLFTSLVKLDLSSVVDAYILPDSLPDTLRTLHIPNDQFQELTYLPPNLLRLTLGSSYVVPLSSTLIPKLVRLTVSNSKFNLTKFLLQNPPVPETLRKLRFPLLKGSWDIPLELLPYHIKQITVPNNPDQILDLRYLPNTVTKISVMSLDRYKQKLPLHKLTHLKTIETSLDYTPVKINIRVIATDTILLLVDNLLSGVFKLSMDNWNNDLFEMLKVKFNLFLSYSN